MYVFMCICVYHIYICTYIHTHIYGLNSKESAYQCRRRGFDPWPGRVPWKRNWQPTPAFLPGNPHGQRKLTDYRLGGHKELDTTEQLSTANDSLEHLASHVSSNTAFNFKYFGWMYLKIYLPFENTF